MRRTGTVRRVSAAFAALSLVARELGEIWPAWMKVVPRRRERPLSRAGARPFTASIRVVPFLGRPSARIVRCVDDYGPTHLLHLRQPIREAERLVILVDAAQLEAIAESERRARR